MANLFSRQPLWIIGIIIANIILSVWSIYSDPVINNDGVVYLGLAEYFSQGEWQKVFNYYNWPFYSLFISLTSSLLSLSFENSAHLLNLVFATSLCIAFVCIVNEFSPQNKTLLMIATLVIIFFPSISKYRPFITRDFGYLSFYLWSLYFAFQFIRSPSKRQAIYWFCFSSISCLFRFEGITFIVLIPLLYCAYNYRAINFQRRHLLLTLPSVLIFFGLVLLWFLRTKYEILISLSSGHDSTLLKILSIIIGNISNRLEGDEFQFTAIINLIYSNFSIVTYEVLRRLAIFYFFLSVYAIYKRLCFKSNIEFKIWTIYIALNFILLCIFSLVASFFVSRYAMAVVLTILIPAPFAIESFYRQYKHLKPYKKLATLLGLSLLVFISFDRFEVVSDKNHLKNSGYWIKANIAPDAKLYSNDRLITYYAGKGPEVTLFSASDNTLVQAHIKSGYIKRFDYFAFQAHLNREDEMMSTKIHHELFGAPIHIETNDGIYVYIYKL